MISITQGSTTAQAPQELIAPSSVKFRLADDERLYGTKRNTLHVFLMSQERATSKDGPSRGSSVMNRTASLI